MKDVMSRHISSDIINSKKQGFSSPDGSWFKGESIDFVKKRIYNKGSKLYDIMDYNSVIPIINEHMNGDNNKRLLIWSLLYLDEWLKTEF